MKRRSRNEKGFLLVIVLWVAFGLVALTIGFASSTTLEMRAADNRLSNSAANQAVQGATRYLRSLLNQYSTNGMAPPAEAVIAEAVPVGDSHFWLIGRTNGSANLRGEIVYGIVDEGAKLNLNTASAEMLQLLPRMTPALAGAIVDWRDTNSDISANGAESESYGRQQPAYQCKNANFESVEELRLVYGMNLEIVLGEDWNRNGTLDPNETDQNGNGKADPGLVDFVTAWSREPNTGKTNVNSRSDLTSLLKSFLDESRAAQIAARVAGSTISSPLEFYLRSNMTSDEFAKIWPYITVNTNSQYLEGRLNINTAPAEVLACLPGMTEDRAKELVSYRESSSSQTTSIAWIVRAIGLSGNDALNFARQVGDTITTFSYQYSADIAALGPYGRGYRRSRVVFDLSDGSAKIVYRQDLSHLGWGLGRDVRERWFLTSRNP